MMTPENRHHQQKTVMFLVFKVPAIQITSRERKTNYYQVDEKLTTCADVDPKYAKRMEERPDSISPI